MLVPAARCDHGDKLAFVQSAPIPRPRDSGPSSSEPAREVPLLTAIPQAKLAAQRPYSWTETDVHSRPGPATTSVVKS
ncbi:hypothetical protein GY45DRAFT_1315541 [Cubamyces sp. BRFM 1775]|nr:hypothetical protein GY45DRAFT_1315541 [Cubamyces sp. BRFM 1775]